MYQNAVYIFISRYRKLFWFPERNCWQQKSRAVSSGIHFFECSLGKYNCAIFIIVEYVWYVLGMGGLFGLPGVWAAAKRPILNRLKIILHSNGINNCDNVYGSDIKRLLNKSFSSAKTKFLFSN